MEVLLNIETAIFGTLIIGMGYIGMSAKYRLKGLFFRDRDVFDRFIQSLILGTFTFILTLKIKVVTFTTERNVVSYLIDNPSFFIIQLFLIFISVFVLIGVDDYIEKNLIA